MPSCTYSRIIHFSFYLKKLAVLKESTSTYLLIALLRLLFLLLSNCCSSSEEEDEDLIDDDLLSILGNFVANNPVEEASSDEDNEADVWKEIEADIKIPVLERSVILLLKR